MPTVQLVCDDGGTEAVELKDRPIAIGRHPDNDIIIKDDLASRFHCVIEPSEDGFRVRDLGSRNGTRVNNQRVEDAVLSAGDELRVGGRTFHLQSEASTQEKRAEARAKAPETDPPWAVDLRETIESLPPQSSADEAVILIDAEGRPTDALSREGDGPKAIRLALLAASKARATDLHLEPKGESVHLRSRVDGQMLRLTELPNEVGQRAMGLIKTACQMKTAGRDAVLDGHFSARYQSRRVDFRASFTPSVQGQKLVIRVLDSRDTPKSLNEINLAPYMLQRVRKSCQQDSGMVLVCGPTGSGKTTTLYNAVREIDRDTKNVVTIEDPVEYHLEGVTQIPADVGQGNTFGSLLRSVLRQDPDVILVGEIRDEETARTAMQAAMTGHLVFSTVHAKDTIGAVFRLLDLGVEQYLVANSMDLIMAQRLVRVLCDHCKRPVQPTPGQATRIGRYLEGAKHIYTAAGCSKCLHTGYRGRRALFELLEFNDDLRDVVLNDPTIHAMKRVIEQGLFTTLQQSGWQLVAKGVTSIDEVERVAG